MARKSRIKTPIAEQAPTIRKNNFKEGKKKRFAVYNVKMHLVLLNAP